LQRISDLEDEMGRPGVLGDNWWAASGDGSDGSTRVIDAANSWMGKRARWEAMYRNDVSWRPIVYPGSIFKDSNEVVPLSRRICRQMQARGDNYFFATDPWFSTEVENSNDTLLGAKLDRYTQWKLKKTKSKKHKQRALLACSHRRPWTACSMRRCASEKRLNRFCLSLIAWLLRALRL
jgi:hypothetical protein